MTLATSLASQVANSVLPIGEFNISARLRKQTAGMRNEFGEWEDGTEEVSDIQIVYTPGIKDRQSLPEGLQDTEMATLYYHGQLESLRAGETNGDIIEIDGSAYRAIQVERWGAYTTIIASRQDRE